MKVLVVDDNYENRYMLEMLLKGNGHDVLSSTNGAEALEWIKSDTIELIISDILMPVMDGFQLCRMVKTDESTSHIPFIIYTATYTGPQDEAFAIKIGADRFILKPCEPGVFMDAVRDVITTAGHTAGATTVEQPQEEEILKLYNERLIKKLEQKMIELENEIQARHTSEEFLKRSEERYKSLYNSIRDAIAVADINRNVIDCNQAFIDLFGYSLQEIAGKQTTVLYKDAEEFRRMGDVLKAHINEPGFLHDFDFRKKNGMIFPGEINTFYLRNDEGTVTGFIGLIRDITEKKQSEKKRENLESQLYQAQKMESVGRLAGGLAHDFNNLLSVILGYGDILLKSLDSENPLHDKAKYICQAGGKAADLIKKLLAFSRKQLLEMKMVDINTVVTEFEKLIRRLIGEDVQLTLVLSSEPLMVQADTIQLEQVLMNMAVNARDAMPDGGSLIIETMKIDSIDSCPNKTQNGNPGNCAMITITDTGCGMDQVILERIFDPFFTTKEADKGTGLGLATSYGIINQHGGNISVYSEPGKGTIFRIYLPLCDTLSKPVYKQKQHYELETGSETVMVVEDDPHLRNLVNQILAGQGYTVLAPDTAEDAVEKAKGYEKSIHLVLTDVIMPGKNGPEVFSDIFKHHPEAKVLYMSGYTDNMFISQGLQKNEISFIQKPFTVNGLLNKCQQVLHGK